MKTSEMSAVVLAGGKSSRMGKNKMLLPLGDSTIIGTLLATLTKLFGECVLVTDHPEAYGDWRVKITADLIYGTEKNSLTGIHAGLSVASNPYSFVVAGDMPFVEPELLCRLAALSGKDDVIIPQQGEYFQPLCAIYHKNCLPHIEELLARRHYKILDFFNAVSVRHVDAAELLPYDRQLWSFFNVNNPDDYRLAQEFVEQFKAERLKGIL